LRHLFRIWNDIAGSLHGVPAKLETQLGKFLRARRGEMTYAQFSRKVGLPPSTLHRLEQGTQSITLRGLQQIMRRLKCAVRDIFPES
jgi:transcriptional regulator with XRE-family HTH domain